MAVPGKRWMRRGRTELVACLDLDQPQPRAGEQLVPLARGRARLKPSHQLPQLHHSFVLWKHLVPKLAVRPGSGGSSSGPQGV
jgi:hypothetical protein